ncbi:MAG: hypothetical protein HOP17_10365 [Acidobacteria bacterium]|nr:hypothetical protein [Acidobacteriota bacterium]
MGLPSIENFDVSFIQRTSDNLKDYNGPNDFTMLLNSLLGLIVVPNETSEGREFTFDFLGKSLTEFKELKPIFLKNAERLLKGSEEVEQKKFFWLSRSNNERDVSDITLREFLKRMRNGVAHFGITPIALPESKKEWCGVILRNYREDEQGDGTKTETMNFEVCLMQGELEALADLISQKYLQTVITQQ